MGTNNGVKQMNITWQNWMTSFQTALVAAMARAGFDAEALKMERCVVDQTWGSLCGLVFSGDVELARRAADYCAAWMARHLPQAMFAYNCQRSIGAAVEMRRGSYDWHRADSLRGEAASLPAGFACPIYYHPCAE